MRRKSGHENRYSGGKKCGGGAQKEMLALGVLDRMGGRENGPWSKIQARLCPTIIAVAANELKKRRQRTNL